jgi:methylenetetrahydrofolate reductase (NADPH)
MSLAARLGERLSPMATNRAAALEVSFEFFPPKSCAQDASLWSSLERLAVLEPRFVSMTYGADGGTRGRTRELVLRIQRETSLLPAPHLTCVGASRAEVDALARDYWGAGVRHLVALRGDPPGGAGAGYEPRPDGYAYAADLVAGLRRIGDFEISVAAYPEVHPEAPDAGFDLDNLKRKIEAGASRAITQFCFDTGAFLRFRERAARAGIAAPLVAGILPITNFARTAAFARKCGAGLPAWLFTLFEGLDEDCDLRALVAAATAVEQCRQLQREGVQAFHFYTLNRADLTLAICQVLRWSEAAEARLAACGDRPARVQA